MSSAPVEPTVATDPHQLPPAHELVGESNIRKSAVNPEDNHHIVGPHGAQLPEVQRKIMLAYDASPESKSAVEFLRKSVLAQGDHLFLLAVLPISIYDPAMSYVPLEMSYNNVEEVQKLLKEMRTAALHNLKVIADSLAPLGITTTCHALHGDAPQSIVRAAEYHHIDIITVGRRKLSRFQKWVSTGSISAFVVQNSHCSVLIAK